ncbi:peptidylprolyl isomerase [Rhodoferax sp.]|uniref:peptidylprolyl isomerase n=1 Tax=Rhodoferax sp. TaxID=50421 RepID=UPI00274DC9F3|nr:peptidylprolyl isomerase [Rhodoferax sp.]
MTHRVLALTVATLSALVVLSAQAQGLRPAPARTVAPVAVAETTQRPADFIVAVVNSEPITNNEVHARALRMRAQMAQGANLPEMSEFKRDALQRLIDERAQLQQAVDTGIRVDDSSVDQAEQTVAQQNQISVADLRRQLVRDGLNVAQFRRELRDQILLTRLRERDVDARVRVSDLEIDQYISERQRDTDPAAQEVNLAQVLVQVPDGANADQVATLQAKAERVLSRARAGEAFALLVREVSDAPDRVNGGQLGLRPADRYPPLFVEATQGLAAGAISNVVRSGAGFHILKVVERRVAGMPATTITQSQARHILLLLTPKLGEKEALAMLSELRARIMAGKADFAALAREHSQDGSAPQGGDLGWTSVGQFVPEFEQVMNRLGVAEISQPFVSRFGAHVVQVIDRRDITLTQREQRELVRSMLKEKKMDEAYVNWAQDVRGKAYVELREPPQ